MKKIRFIMLILALLICLGCVSCYKNDDNLCTQLKTQEVSAAVNPSATPGGSVLSSTSHKTEGVTYLTYGENNLEVLNSHITLEQLGKYASNSIEYALNDLGDSYTMSIIDAPGIEGYQYKDKGIQLFIPIDEYGVKNEYISAIECDPKMFCFKGITNGMNFEQIQCYIAPCETIIDDSDLLGIVTYELRYEINGVKIIFFAWDEKGEESFNVSIVNDFGEENKYERITIKQLESLFSTPESQYIKNYGNALIYDNINKEYSYHSINFSFDGENLKKISLPANYEIEGARWGMDFDSIIKILGDNKVIEGEGEDGPYYSLTYEYSNFIIRYFAEFSDGRPVPFILRK